MILTGPEIKKMVREGKIHIKPYVEKQVNPNSYNFRLATKLLVYKNFELDAKKDNPTEEITIPPEGYVLQPGRLYLAHTVEEIGSDFFVPLMHARSSTGRLGLFIYLNSGFGDLGFKHQWTLELYTIHPLRIYPDMQLGQILFHQPTGEIELYEGRYKGSIGVVPSRMWKD